jgi:xanthine/CO dehydrogenase XdhC/CoxF family maturation factor
VDFRLGPEAPEAIHAPAGISCGAKTPGGLAAEASASDILVAPEGATTQRLAEVRWKMRSGVPGVEL